MTTQQHRTLLIFTAIWVIVLPFLWAFQLSWMLVCPYIVALPRFWPEFFIGDECRSADRSYSGRAHWGLLRSARFRQSA